MSAYRSLSSVVTYLRWSSGPSGPKSTGLSGGHAADVLHRGLAPLGPPRTVRSPCAAPSGVFSSLRSPQRQPRGLRPYCGRSGIHVPRPGRRSPGISWAIPGLPRVRLLARVSESLLRSSAADTDRKPDLGPGETEAPALLTAIRRPSSAPWCGHILRLDLLDRRLGAQQASDFLYCLWPERSRFIVEQPIIHVLRLRRHVSIFPDSQASIDVRCSCWGKARGPTSDGSSAIADSPRPLDLVIGFFPRCMLVRPVDHKLGSGQAAAACRSLSWQWTRAPRTCRPARGRGREWPPGVDTGCGGDLGGRAAAATSSPW